MIITEMYDGQGLGNQLWVYASARSIAEKLNVPFILIGSERFKGKSFLKIPTTIGISSEQANEFISKSKWKTFNEILYYDKELDYISSGYDPRVLDISCTNKISGLFQSEKYFFDDLEKIKGYFEIDKSLLSKNKISDETCVINLRGGEYKRHKNFILPISYWENAMKNILRMTTVKRFLVVTDDVRYAHAMFPGVEVLQGGIGDCYASIFNAKYLILSNSTFSYFPVKTSGNSRFVIAPKYWARFGNRHNRWASTANLYQSWLWQDTSGDISTFDECLQECEATEAEYEEKFFIRTTIDQVQKPGIRQLLPASMRHGAKRALSLIFPRHFG